MKNRTFVKQSDAGFTILEVIVVAVIIGVLGAIAAPGWLAFVNRQRASTAKDEVQQAIRTAQSEAKQRRRRMSIEFYSSDDSASGIPEIEQNGFRQVLGQGEFEEGMIDLAAFDSDGNDVPELVFTSDGSLSVEDGDYAGDAPSLPVIISLEAPAGSNNKRCIQIETILGSIDSGSGADCNE